MKVGGGQNTDLEIWLGQIGHVRYMGDHSSVSCGATVRRFNNIWPHINSDTINNTRNYSKNSSWVIQSKVILTEVTKTEDDIGRVILSLHWGMMNWKHLQINWWLLNLML